MIKYRYHYDLILNSLLNIHCILILCNPASIDGNDNTIKSLKNHPKIKIFFDGIGRLTILNIFSFVEPMLENFNNLTENETNYLLEGEYINLEFIKDILENEIYDKIIIGSGQHFTRLIYKEKYIKHYNKVLNILRDYHHKLYCCGLCERNNIKYPLYIHERTANNKKNKWYNELTLFKLSNL